MDDMESWELNERDGLSNGLIDATKRHYKLDEATFSDVIFFQRYGTHTDVPLTIYLEFLDIYVNGGNVFCQTPGARLGPRHSDWRPSTNKGAAER